MSKSTQTDRTHGVGFGWFISICIIVVLVVAGFGAASWCYFGKPCNAAAFGDMFGAINALFSALAFAGVVYAMLQQQQALLYQFQEMEDTRKAMQQAAKAHSKNAEIQKRNLELEMLAAEPIFQPIFVCERNQMGNLESALTVTNRGGIAVNINVTDLRDTQDTNNWLASQQVLDKNDQTTFRFELPEGKNRIRFSCEDKFKNEHVHILEVFVHEHEADIDLVKTTRNAKEAD